jgi:hypothetical protein
MRRKPFQFGGKIPECQHLKKSEPFAPPSLTAGIDIFLIALIIYSTIKKLNKN